MFIVDVKNIRFSYESGKKILKGIDFKIEEGEFIAIIGSSGCGKSTLCHILCGIIPNAVGGEISGDAIMNGISLRKAEMRTLAETVGFVMQDPDRQIVTSTVEDELAFGPENLCVPPEEIRRRVDDTLQLLGLESLREENPNRLSGGQKQLVAIGSVLTLQPKIFILDEPFSHLDEDVKENLENLLSELKRQGKTIIVVEHDHNMVKNADKWLLLEDGKVKSYDTPEKVREFL